MTDSAPTPRRRFRFGLRSLFVVVVIAAIPCAWVPYARSWIRERQEARKTRDWYFEERFRRMAPGGLWMFGEQGVSRIELPDVANAYERKAARRLFPEAEMGSLQFRHKRK